MRSPGNLGDFAKLLAFAGVMVVVSACSDTTTSDNPSTPAATVTPDVGYRGDEAKPRWLRFERGARGYLVDGIGTTDAHSVKVCDTPEEWVSDSFRGCKAEPAGQIVTVRKTDLMVMISEPSPIQVQAKTWRGVMAQDEVVPILPVSTDVDCSGADGPTTLQRPDESDNLPLDGDVIFETTRAQDPKNATVVDVVVVYGNGKGKRGKLAFNTLDCKTAGFLPEFDNEDTEISITSK